MHTHNISPVAQQRREDTPAPVASAAQQGAIREQIDLIARTSRLLPGSVKAALWNRIRVDYGLSHIHELPARHVDAVLMMLDEVKRECDAFARRISQQKERYIREVVGAGYRSTAWRSHRTSGRSAARRRPT